jgi:Trypsin
MEKFLLFAVITSTLMINFSVSFRLGIIGGRTSDIEDFPYQAAYLYNEQLKCGASIISESWALTAGG